MGAFTRPGFDPDPSSVVNSDVLGGPGRVNNDTGSSRRGLLVSAKPYFKIWAAEALLSDDFDALTDQERSIWLLCMCVSSLENPRWRTKITPRLAAKCKTTEKKLVAALNSMAELGMVTIVDGWIFFETAERWNEDTDGRAKPSDSRERVAERVAKHRASKVTPPVTPPVTRYSNAHKEEEKEKEKEEEEEKDKDKDDGRYTPAAAAAELPSAIREMRDTIMSKLPQSQQRDALIWDEAESFARDYAGQEEALARAIDEIRRLVPRRLPYPSTLREFMPLPDLDPVDQWRDALAQSANGLSQDELRAHYGRDRIRHLPVGETG